jgi:hypothetical protein
MSLDDCPPIHKRRQERREAEQIIKQKATDLYATFDQNERTLVRFGMFPADKMKQLDDELLALAAQGTFPMFDKCDLARLSAVAIMDAANAGPDKLMV